MCDPLTITAITTGITTAAASASAGAATVGAAAMGAGTVGGSLASTAGAIGGAVSGFGSGVASAVGGATVGQIAGALGTYGMIGASIGQGVDQKQKADVAQPASKDTANLAKAELSAQAQEGAEAAAQEKFEIAREILASRGAAQNSELSERSKTAAERQAQFQAGLDTATIDRNQEIQASQRAREGQAARISRQSEQNSIGGGSAELAGNIIGGAFRAAGSGLQIRRQIDEE